MGKLLLGVTFAVLLAGGVSGGERRCSSAYGPCEGDPPYKQRADYFFSFYTRCGNTVACARRTYNDMVRLYGQPDPYDREKYRMFIVRLGQRERGEITQEQFEALSDRDDNEIDARERKDEASVLSAMPPPPADDLGPLPDLNTPRQMTCFQIGQFYDCR